MSGIDYEAQWERDLEHDLEVGIPLAWGHEGDFDVIKDDNGRKMGDLLDEFDVTTGGEVNVTSSHGYSYSIDPRRLLRSCLKIAHYIDADSVERIGRIKMFEARANFLRDEESFDRVTREVLAKIAEKETQETVPDDTTPPSQ